MSGESLGLQLVELGLVDRARVEQRLRRCDRLCRVARGRNLLDVRVCSLLRVGVRSQRTLGHAAATEDQVRERRQVRQHDEEEDPDGLPQTTELVVPEQVADDLEQDDQVRHEGEDQQGVPEEIPERVEHELQPLSREGGPAPDPGDGATHYEVTRNNPRNPHPPRTSGSDRCASFAHCVCQCIANVAPNRACVSSHRHRSPRLATRR
ncbi:hypothetical protein RHCRD62_10403 [Rhodococcus sp. RD6.2]|nr:hypothetical protein RHCRD62_10403 [Rhodococcus sp. RD6.2]